MKSCIWGLDWVAVVCIIEVTTLWIKQYIVYVLWAFGTSNTGHIRVGDHLNKVTIDWSSTVLSQQSKHANTKMFKWPFHPWDTNYPKWKGHLNVPMFACVVCCVYCTMKISDFLYNTVPLSRKFTNECDWLVSLAISHTSAKRECEWAHASDALPIRESKLASAKLENTREYSQTNTRVLAIVLAIELASTWNHSRG